MKAGKNIYLIGPMGAGKTSIGRALARSFNLSFYDSDQVVEERAGADLLWIYDLEGEDGFRKREIKVIAELVKLQDIVLATGGGTVASLENRTVLAETGTIIYLKTTLEDQLKRTGYSKKRPLASAIEERRNTLIDLHAEYEPLYMELANIIYPTQGKATQVIIKELKQFILSV